MLTKFKNIIKNKKVISLLLGGIAVLSFPPWNLFFFQIISFAFFFYLINSEISKKELFKLGYYFGFGMFSVGSVWISHALTIEGLSYKWLAPIPPILGGFYLGLYPMLSVLAICFVKPGIRRLFAFAASWTIFEYFRGIVFTGFPWSPLGSMWANYPNMLQLASLVGVFGVSYFCILEACSFGLISKPIKQKKNLIVLLPILLLVSQFIFGQVRLLKSDTSMVRGHVFRLVQGNIPQGQKWDAKIAERSFMKYVHLSRSKGAEGITHVLWPETATNYFLQTDEFAHGMITSALTPGSILLAGSLRYEGNIGRLNPITRKPEFKIFNSIVAINDIGVNIGSYDKAHLVPFGEYAPLSSIFPFMHKIVPVPFDFARGPGPTTVNIPRTLPVGMLVCYEVIFPGKVVNKNDPRPYWLMNATNDAWYGFSAGPYQHLASAQLRAVEEGLPLLRVANTGISAVIDAYGRVLKSLPLFATGVIDSELPKRTENNTFFSLYGNVIPLLLSIISFLIALLIGKKK
ncbi:MAG: apolipoprotein N-acyltransferase [Alphaproteobacteria bacterium]|nr:apolipoprotein N-acyltransferase [Alphaproteobacteria bacterium]